MQCFGSLVGARADDMEFCFGKACLRCEDALWTNYSSTILFFFSFGESSAAGICKIYPFVVPVNANILTVLIPLLSL